MSVPATGTATWKASYKINIRGVDDDHSILVGLVDELEEAVLAGRGKSIVADILDRLVVYVKLHFAREERLMRAHRYPELEAHCAEHDGFARKVVEYQDDYHQGRAELSGEVLRFLSNWVVSHILGVDQKLGPYLHERGVT